VQVTTNKLYTPALKRKTGKNSPVILSLHTSFIIDCVFWLSSKSASLWIDDENLGSLSINYSRLVAYYMNADCFTWHFLFQSILYDHLNTETTTYLNKFFHSFEGLMSMLRRVLKQFFKLELFLRKMSGFLAVKVA